MPEPGFWYGRKRARGTLIDIDREGFVLKVVLDDGRRVLTDFNRRNHPYGPFRGRRVEVGLHPDPDKPARLIRIEPTREFLERQVDILSETAPESGAP